MPIRKRGEPSPEPPKKPPKKKAASPTSKGSRSKASKPTEPVEPSKKSKARSKTEPKAPGKPRKAPVASKGTKTRTKVEAPVLDDVGPVGVDDLNDRHRRFVQEYLIDSNGKRSAIAAGYSAKTAEAQASRLLRNVKVAAAVRKGQRALGDHLGITAERVLEEFARIAFGDVRDVMTWGPTDGGRHGLQLIPSDELDANSAAAVAEVKIKRAFRPNPEVDPDGNPLPAIEVEEVGVKMHDKMAALNALAKRLGLFAPDKVDLNVNADPNAVRNRILDKLTRLAPKPAEGNE